MRNYFRHIPPPLTAVVALGVGNQLGQVLLMRELLMVFHGHELTLGITLAFWVAWEAAGSYGGAHIAQRTCRPQRALMWLIAAAVIVMPATILALRLSRGFFDPTPGTHLSLYDTLRTSLLVLGPICILMGAQFAFLARFWREHRRAKDMSGASRTYLGEAGGHMAGGLVFSLLLVHMLSPLQISAIMGVLLLGGILPLLSASRYIRAMTGILLVLILALFPFLNNLDQWAYRIQWRQFVADSELIQTRESRYGTINVAQRHGQYSFFQSNHLVFSTGGYEDDMVGMEEIEAAQLAHLAVSQHGDPQRALLIGGGMRGMLREMLRYPQLSIDYVELDKALINVADQYLPDSTRQALRDERVNIITLDGRRHLKTTDSEYDLVIVDLPDPATAVLNRFYTREFFLETRDRLAPGGIVTITLTSTPGLRDPAIVNRNAAVYHTMRDVFANVVVGGADTCLFFASDTPEQITADIQTLSERYRRHEIAPPAFSERHFHMLLQDTVVRRKNWILRNHGRRPGAVHESPETGPLFPGTLSEQRAEEPELPPVDQRFFINSDFHPIGYFHNLIFLDRMTDHRVAGMLSRLLHIRLWWVVLIVAVLTTVAPALRLIARKTGGNCCRSYAIGYSVFAIGFSSMVFEVALIFSFQSIYGYVFEQIGLIVALFMGGLAVGAGFSERYLTGKKALRTISFVQAGFVIFAAALFAGLPAMAAIRSPALIFALFAAATFSAGMLNGAHYPIASAYRHYLAGKTERSAGFVYALELVGACLGAALAGVALVPVLGITGACVAAGAFNAGALVILWIV